MAEDHPVNQKLAVRLLEKRGHAVVLAGDGKEALAALARQPFDMVLMDVQMPEMDGFEAAERIRRDEAGTGRHVPILAMTAYAMKGDRERCLEAGMDGYVTKPIQPQELFEAIDRLLPPARRRRRYRRRRRAGSARRAEALRRVGDDAELLGELAGLFLDPFRNSWPSCGRPSAAATARRCHAWPIPSRDRSASSAPASPSRRRCVWRRRPARAT